VGLVYVSKDARARNDVSCLNNYVISPFSRGFYTRASLAGRNEIMSTGYSCRQIIFRTLQQPPKHPAVLQ
jgi:hypothetical protein